MTVWPSSALKHPYDCSGMECHYRASCFSGKSPDPEFEDLSSGVDSICENGINSDKLPNLSESQVLHLYQEK